MEAAFKSFNMEVPFNKTWLTGREIEYIKEAMAGQVSGDGRFSRLVSSLLEQKLGTTKVLMTTSATHALEMAALLTGLKPGDEVIMPSFTFPSTANAVLLRGARPVFAEIREDTLNLDPADVLRKITPGTKAIIPVHYGGIGCEMDRLMEIARGHGLYVIEDAAQAVNARYRGKPLGTWGHLGCYSFHGTKNYTSGEGGALLVNGSDGVLAERAGVIRQKGTDRERFLRGEVEKYCWVGIGSNYTPSEILMAFLYAQLEDMDAITARRKAVHDSYAQGLAKYVEAGMIKTTSIPPECESNYHVFYLILDSKKTRDRVINELAQRGIEAVTHFMPLHSSLMGRELGYLPQDLPVTERIAGGLLRLPVYAGMIRDEISYVLENLQEILERLEV